MTGDVVLLRALGLGDFLTAVPAYRAVRRAHPGRRIVLAAPAALAELARLTGAIDAVHPTNDLSAPLDLPPPAVAVNLHGRGPQSHWLLERTRPGERLGFTGPDTPPGWSGPPWQDHEHDVDRWCRLLAHHGMDPDPEDLLLAAPAQPPPVAGATIVHPGAQYGCRRWPPARYAVVARELTRTGHRVVVTGGPGERLLAAEVADRAGLPDSANLAGATSTGQLAALVASARLLVSADTGIAHLATAFGTPSVVLFGPVSPALWGPRTSGPHRALWHPESVRGDRWAAEPDPALLAVTAEEVLAGCASSAASAWRNAEACGRI